MMLWVMFISPPIDKKDNSSSNQGDNSIDPQNCSNEYSTKSKTQGNANASKRCFDSGLVGV